MLVLCTFFCYFCEINPACDPFFCARFQKNPAHYAGFREKPVHYAEFGAGCWENPAHYAGFREKPAYCAGFYFSARDYANGLLQYHPI